MKKGFTLIETLTVVIIIGILTAIALPQYRKVIERSRFTKAQVMAKSIYDSCERLVSEFGVETYSVLRSKHPAAAKISRLDIGSTDLLPAGFVIPDVNGMVIMGSGFSYTLGSHPTTGECYVTLEKTSGNYNGTTLTYDGSAFTCSDDGMGSCAIYGLD